ncbi:MAG: hypothetical protein CV088_13910 [Nitrospira sp. LK70]|nr:hypothetical protein [Nitrospira sp. LK70]
MQRGHEVYFHADALQGLTFRQFEDGREVAFGLEDGKKDPQAIVVALPPPIARVL